MAAMMPSASVANDYDNDALERDLIDPDDGKLPLLRRLQLRAEDTREPASVSTSGAIHGNCILWRGAVC